MGVSKPQAKMRGMTFGKRPFYARLMTAFGVGLFSLTVQAEGLGELSAEDYYGARYFESAQEHPRVQKAKSEKRKIALVARDLRWKRSKLRAALEHFRAVGADPMKLGTTEGKAALEATRVKGRVIEFQLDDSEPKHVVAYVRWRGSKNKDVIKEASAIAQAIGSKVPFVSTLSLAAVHPKGAKDSKPVWSAKIAHTAMQRIQARRIDDYADRMYAGLFEDKKAVRF